MELYHGSYCEIKNPNISFSRDSLDFGRGFYLTNIKQQAIEWVNRFIRREKDGCVNIYDIDLDGLSKIYKIKVKRFGIIPSKKLTEQAQEKAWQELINK